MKIFRNKGNAGFSMLEVLVASTILVIIVMMLAMLFQQTGIAWRTGVRRAGIFMQARSVIGAIQRDAVKAVDQRSIPEELRDKLGGEQNFGASSMSFFTLAANGFEDDDFSRSPRRALSHITYESSGKRTEITLLANGSIESTESSVSITLDEDKTAPQTSPPSFQYTYADGDTEFPISVRLKSSVTSEGYNLDIGAGSAGPDTVWGTKDDITTWLDN